MSGKNHDRAQHYLRHRTSKPDTTDPKTTSAKTSDITSNQLQPKEQKSQKTDFPKRHPETTHNKQTRINTTSRLS